MLERNGYPFARTGIASTDPDPDPDYSTLPSGLIVPEHVAAEQECRASRPRAVDLFSGCGGMVLGFIQAGFEVFAAVDHDAIAAHTYLYKLGAYPCRFHFIEDADRDRMERVLAMSYRPGANGLIAAHTAGSGWRAHHPEAPGVSLFVLGDMRKLQGADLLRLLGLRPGELDLLAGGPPCQGFSSGGKRNAIDIRNSLVFELARLVCEINPKTAVFENVPGIIDMVTPEGVPVLDALCRIPEDGGFGGMDAFHRSIKAQVGNVGLIRSKRPPRPESGAEEDAQLDLFDEAGAA